MIIIYANQMFVYISASNIKLTRVCEIFTIDANPIIFLRLRFIIKRFIFCLIILMQFILSDIKLSSILIVFS